MSIQNETPIIQKIYDFYKDQYLVIEKMPKKDKYTLGEKLEKTTLELMESLIAAGFVHKLNKISHLEQAATKLDLLKVLIRLGRDIKAIPDSKYLFLEEKLQEIGRMLGGWLKSLR